MMQTNYDPNLDDSDGGVTVPHCHPLYMERILKIWKKQYDLYWINSLQNNLLAF
jgi:hypothetical protein